MIERQLTPDNSEVAHLMNLIVKELRGHVVERPMCVKEAAEFLGISQRTMYQWIKDGVIPSKVVHYKGSRPFFFPSELRDEIKRS
jgi:excisionase family DNA binding protein